MSGTRTSTDRARRAGSFDRRHFLIAAGGFLAAAAFPWHRWLRDLRFTAIPIEEHSPNAALGHRLRDGTIPAEAPAGAIEDVPVLVLGGGIAGLSAAWWLSRNGFSDYLLLELEDRTGGNSMSGENAVSAYPWGAHYLPIPNAESRFVHEFLEEIGAITGRDGKGRPTFDETMICHDAVERLWIEGKFQEGIVPQAGLTGDERAEMRRFFDEMRRFGDRKGSDGRPIFAIPIAEGSRDRFRAKDLAELDRMSMAEWLDREGYRSRPLRWYLNYACRDDFGSPLERTSAWAGIHYHAARRGVAANADSQAILAWPEGNGFLAGKLRALGAGKIRAGEAATRISVEGDAVLVDTLRANDGARSRIRAKSVVVATPRFVANRILPEAARAPIDSAVYAPWLVANLTVEDLPGTTEEGHAPLTAWDNVSYYSDSLGYVVATHQTESIARGSVLTHYWPLSDRPAKEARLRAARTTPAEWRERILADLEGMHPDIRSRVTRIDYRVWGHGMISPAPGYLSGDERAGLERSFGRVHFAHSDISGMSLFEEAQYRGVLAAKRVLSDLGRTERRGKV
ncbi:MAG: FAD-dependent oxidoreductase [Bdellovibrionales bacterium]|nr:FAD-dependent oxidoreductase [Bdellovibrionales bacterium]